MKLEWNESAKNSFRSDLGRVAGGCAVGVGKANLHGKRVATGYGKVAMPQEMENQFRMSPAHTIYIGDGRSVLYLLRKTHARTCELAKHL
jgi:hypothetical protein